MHQRLPPHAPEAAAPRTRGCRHVQVAWHTSEVSPPWRPPPEPHAVTFLHKHLSAPLLWIPLCPPAPNGSAAAAAAANADADADAGVDAGADADASLEQGLPLAVGAVGRLRSGSLAVAPVWLVSLGSEPEAGWGGALPPPFAYLHLTNMWKCAHLILLHLILVHLILLHPMLLHLILLHLMLLHHVIQAAALCTPGCNLMYSRLQPYVLQAATLCTPACSPV